MMHVPPYPLVLFHLSRIHKDATRRCDESFNRADGINAWGLLSVAWPRSTRALGVLGAVYDRVLGVCIRELVGLWAGLKEGVGY